MAQIDENDDDEDLALHRASGAALRNITDGVRAIVAAGNATEDSEAAQRRRSSVEDVIAKINVFQEDPQLLDAHLAKIVPPLVESFSKIVLSNRRNNIAGLSTALFDYSELLYVLCKVRGQKVITRFFANEPRNLGPMLDILKDCIQTLPDTSSSMTKSTGEHGMLSEGMTSSKSMTWQMRYILMLWISHLVLTPFDLSTIVEGMATTESLDMDLPHMLPRVACDIVQTARAHLFARTKEQNAAASVLVKLALRPDMSKLGVLQSLVQWSLSNISIAQGTTSEDGNKLNGYLLFLNGLLVSSKGGDVVAHLPRIYKSLDFALSRGQWLKEASSTTKRFVIKILRNTATILLEADSQGVSASQTVLETMHELGVVETVIDFLLRILADNDTQVRYAASKALSIITTKLQPEMAEELVVTVTSAFDEDVIYHGASKNVASVSATMWHGLTLTLSHMLFRRSTTSGHIPAILDTLHGSLGFEQRSAIGNSIGANVRDAANFGLWSVARRYSSHELNNASLPPTESFQGSTSSIQITACHLLVAACLDPAGNVRRGSSAALQELIGRHPNIIIEGISLVQIVDYHAVGLRGRAMTNVTIKAARLDSLYRKVLLEALRGWRGARATDTLSRNFAATAIARLVNLEPNVSIRIYVRDLVSVIEELPRQEVEWRHGLVQALAEVIVQRVDQVSTLTQKAVLTRKVLFSDLTEMQTLWSLFEGPLLTTQKEVALLSSRSHLTTVSNINLTAALASSVLVLRTLQQSYSIPLAVSDSVLQTFTLCLKTKDNPTLESIPEACIRMSMALSKDQRLRLAETWVAEVKHLLGAKIFGLLTAIAAIWGTLTIESSDSDSEVQHCQRIILDSLLTACASADVDTRVISIRTLTLIINALPFQPSLPGEVVSSLITAIEVALNDYTINERGDVGSLVRTEALAVVECIWRTCTGTDSPQRTNLELAVERLALERLDKVRLRAAMCLEVIHPDRDTKLVAVADVTTYTYFLDSGVAMRRTTATKLRLHDQNAADVPPQLSALLEGITSSTGAGSEALLRISRQALHDLLWALPTLPADTTEENIAPLPSLLDIGNALLSLLSYARTSDRILLPLLDTIAYLFDIGILQRFDQESTAEQTPTFKYRTLLSLLQHSHYKSTSVPKLLAAIGVYRGLGGIEVVRGLVLEKLVGMLGHPFPKVRTAVAETLYVLTWDVDVLGHRVWSAPVRENKDAVEKFRAKWLENGQA